jgi:hypothetical protein
MMVVYLVKSGLCRWGSWPAIREPSPEQILQLTGIFLLMVKISGRSRQVLHLTRSFQFGAKKGACENWRKVELGKSWRVIISVACRDVPDLARLVKAIQTIPTNPMLTSRRVGPLIRKCLPRQ